MQWHTVLAPWSSQCIAGKPSTVTNALAAADITIGGWVAAGAGTALVLVPVPSFPRNATVLMVPAFLPFGIKASRVL